MFSIHSKSVNLCHIYNWVYFNRILLTNINGVTKCTGYSMLKFVLENTNLLKVDQAKTLWCICVTNNKGYVQFSVCRNHDSLLSSFFNCHRIFTTGTTSGAVTLLEYLNSLLVFRRVRLIELVNEMWPAHHAMSGIRTHYCSGDK